MRKSKPYALLQQGVNEKFTVALGDRDPPPVDKTLRLKAPDDRPENRTACQSSTSDPPPDWRFTPYGHGLTDTDLLKVTVFKGGSRKIEWPIDGPEIKPDVRESLDDSRHAKRDLQRLNKSNEQSTKSRLRAAWTLSAADCDWRYMTTLTYPKPNRPTSYEVTALHRKRFCKRAKKFWPKLKLGWILEFTSQKAAHYHVFWAGEAADELDKMPREKFKSQKFDGAIRDREVVRGKLDDKIVEWWSNQAGDGSESFRKFQSGGITEVLQNPDGAGRYVAKEASKRSQKIAPFLVGQWWGISNSARPIACRQYSMSVGDYVAENGMTMFRHLF